MHMFNLFFFFNYDVKKLKKYIEENFGQYTLYIQD